MQRGPPRHARRARSSSRRRRTALLRRHPPLLQRLHVRRFPELLERPLADLADALAGDAEQRADLLERERLGALLQSVVERQDLPLARRQVPLEQTLDEL